MNRIHKDELYQNLSEFLKTRGIELREGSYTHGIRQGCSVLADTINLTQQAVERAKTKTAEKLDELRQTIHEKTAPKPRGANSPTSPTAEAPKEAPTAARPEPSQAERPASRPRLRKPASKKTPRPGQRRKRTGSAES